MTVQRPVIRELTNRIEILEREVRSLRLSLQARCNGGRVEGLRIH